MNDEKLKESPFFDIDGKEYCDEERCLAEMLLDNVLFCNSFQFAYFGETKLQPETIVLFVNCNDVFACGCADAENLPQDEIGNLYKMWKKYKYGTTKWCCIRRNEKPQAQLVKMIKDAGEWDEVYEALPDNSYDKASQTSWNIRQILNLLPWRNK